MIEARLQRTIHSGDGANLFGCRFRGVPLMARMVNGYRTHVGRDHLGTERRSRRGEVIDTCDSFD